MKIKMKTPKTCNCCNKIHTDVPADARYDNEIPSYYFECDCKSTLVYFLLTETQLKAAMEAIVDSIQAP